MVSLRNRLLASYLFLLAFTLGVMAVALFVVTVDVPAPPEPTYRALGPLVRNLNGSIQADFPLNPRERVGNNLPFDATQPTNDPTTNSETSNSLSEIAGTNNVRVVEFSVARDMQNVSKVRATFDSEEELTSESELDLRIDDFTGFRPDWILGPAAKIVFGSFQEKGEEWLFSGIRNNSAEGAILRVVSVKAPTQSLQSFLADIGTSLVRPIVQAGFIGLIIAFALSIIISRTIARPLQAASQAATAVARGDLDQYVPVSGPREVRAVAKAFNRMSAEVRATQKAQRDFLANVSHDLKTPLTSIQGYSQAIIDGAVKEPTHAAEIIYDEASRLNRMVMELTDLARIQAGQLSMKKNNLDIGEVATMVAKKLTVVAQKKNIQLDAMTRSMPLISADGDRMAQVLTNLLSNAIKYTHAGGKVGIETRAHKEGVEIIVWDTGIGIPKSELPRVFERFYQVDKARGPARGTGLGLAITFEIVQAHGGTIRVDSIHGQGTTFTVWLPFAEAKVDSSVPEMA